MIAVSLVYLGYFAALGAFWPYYGPLLVSFGLSPAQATQVLAIGPLFSFLSPPVVGLLADALRARSLLVRVFSLGALAASVGFFVAERSVWLVLATVVVFSACRAPMVPLVDASAMAVARSTGTSFGRMRLWGSVGFLAAALAGAQLAGGRGGPRAVVPLMVALLAVAAVAAFFIPPGEVHRRGPVLAAWLERLRRREMWQFAGATALGAAAHGIYDAGFSLHLERIGLGGPFIGRAWAVGVAVEVGVMAISGRLIAALGAERTFTISLGVAALRWVVLAHLASPALILCLQPLHAVSFGLVYAAGVTVAQDHGSPTAPSAAQGLYTASIALGAFAGMSSAGKLLDELGGRGMFLVAALLAALGASLASGLRRPQ